MHRQQVYREILANQKLDNRSCERFLSLFSSKNTRLTHVNLSDLPVGDGCFRNLLAEHSKSLIHLNISNCTHLTENVLHDMNQILTRVDDFSQISRSVVIREKNLQTSEEKVIEKFYENGILRTVSDDITTEEKLDHISDDVSLFESMGLFSDAHFCGFRDQKLLQLEERRDTGLSSSLIRRGSSSGHIFTPDNCTPSISDSISPLLMPPEIPDTEDFTYSDDVITKKLEVKSYQKSPIEILIIGKSTHILPDYLDDEAKTVCISDQMWQTFIHTDSY